MASAFPRIFRGPRWSPALVRGIARPSLPQLHELRRSMGASGGASEAAPEHGSSSDARGGACERSRPGTIGLFLGMRADGRVRMRRHRAVAVDALLRPAVLAAFLAQGFFGVGLAAEPELEPALLFDPAALQPTLDLPASVTQAEPGRPARKLDVWYVPTPHEVVERMMDVAKIRAGDVVYDLGCGDGRMVIAAAKKFGTRGVGVDLDPARIREARANAKKAGVEQLVTFAVRDLFETDVREATVVMLYLLPQLNRRLKPRLFEQLQPGARVVSHDFDMGPDWPPDEYVKLGNDGIYLWIMPPWEERPRESAPAQ